MKVMNEEDDKFPEDFDNKVRGCKVCLRLKPTGNHSHTKIILALRYLSRALGNRLCFKRLLKYNATFFSMHLVNYPEENSVLDGRVLVKKTPKNCVTYILDFSEKYSQVHETFTKWPNAIHGGAYHIMQRLKTANYGL